MNFTMADSGSWSLGVLIGGPIVGLIILALFVFAGFAFFEREPFIGASVIAAIVIFVALVMSPLGFYPYSGEYHQWRDVSGQVQKIDKRLISSGDNKMEDKFVIRFDGSSLQFGCDDTRCAQVSEGDALKLSCKRAWQYTGTDGYDCRFVSTEVSA